MSLICFVFVFFPTQGWRAAANVIFLFFAEWQCTGCNAAGTSVEAQTVRFLFGTFAITVVTFTWFVIGVGVV